MTSQTALSRAEQLALFALAVAAMADTTTFYLMVDTYGVSSEANPIVRAAYDTAPILPFVLKVLVTVFVALLPRYMVPVAIITALLWGFGAMTNVMTLM